MHLEMWPVLVMQNAWGFRWCPVVHKPCPFFPFLQSVAILNTGISALSGVGLVIGLLASGAMFYYHGKRTADASECTWGLGMRGEGQGRGQAVQRAPGAAPFECRLLLQPWLTASTFHTA